MRLSPTFVFSFARACHQQDFLNRSKKLKNKSIETNYYNWNKKNLILVESSAESNEIILKDKRYKYNNDHRDQIDIEK